MSEAIKKIGIPTAAIAVALVLIAPVMLSTGAFAQTFTVDPVSPPTRSGGLHFTEDPVLTVTKTDTGATLTATGEVAGAGQGAGTATIEADVTATLGCVTRGGGEPSGLEEAGATVTATAPFTPTREGRGEFTVSTEPLTIEDFTTDEGQPFECPSRQQTEVIVGNIEFSNVILTIEAQTGTITADFGSFDP
jgi:hypothetical protein